MMSLSKLRKECDVKYERRKESIVEGALRTLRLTGDVLWLMNHETLREVVFLEPQWVLQLMWLVFILKHEQHMLHPEEKRIIEEFDVFDRKCISKDEIDAILRGRITYDVGKVIKHFYFALISLFDSTHHHFLFYLTFENRDCSQR